MDQPRETAEKPECRVLNVIVSTPDTREGGAVRAGLQFGEALSEYMTVDTVKMRGDHDEEILVDLDITHNVSTIPSYTHLRDLGKKIAGSPKNYMNAAIGTWLTPPRPLESYDVVHLHNPVPLAGFVTVAIACKRANVPYCVTTHGISKVPELPVTMDMPGPLRVLFEIGFLKPYYWVLEGAAHLFALSERDRQQLHQQFPTQSISVLPNGVTPNPPDKDVAQYVERETGIGTKQLLVLFVGKLAKGKGVDDLLATVERVDHELPFEVAVVGTPQDPGYAERLDESERITYLGYTDQELLDRLYQRADIFFFPTRSDVFPLVTLEAMAAATPVITTNVGGLPEQISDEAGILVDSKDVDQMVESLEKLLTNDKVRAEMGEAALDHVRENYTWQSVARQAVATYEMLHREAISEKNSPITTTGNL